MFTYKVAERKVSTIAGYIALPVVTVIRQRQHTGWNGFDPFGKMSGLELTRSMHSTNDTCDPYWEHADWLPPWYILDHWCQQDAQCRQAKQQALLSACERGEVNYSRSDGKTFDDPIHELSARGLLLVKRDSFDAWVVRLEGKCPLPTSSRPFTLPPRPAWAGNEWKPTQQTPRSEPSGVGDSPAVIGVIHEDIDFVNGDDTTPIADETKADHDTYPSEAELRKLGVPTDEIVSVFQVEDTRHENEKWWKARMGNISRANKSLGDALVQKGLPNRGTERYPSWWRPDLVAKWLIENRHLAVYKVAPALRREFPVWAKLFDEQ